MPKINIITLGESGVGKTSLMKRFATGKFKQYTRSTFVDYYPKTITVDDRVTDTVVWDTAGQERYRSLMKRYYAMADGVLLVYDIQDPSTFAELATWLTMLRSENETAILLLVGNKKEDPGARLVSDDDIETFAEAHQVQHLEVSAKTGENVDSAFYSLTKQILISKGLLTSAKSYESSEERSKSKKSTRGLGKKEEEPEISFSYYKTPTPPEEKRLMDDDDNVILAERDEKPRKKGCRC